MGAFITVYSKTNNLSEYMTVCFAAHSEAVELTYYLIGKLFNCATIPLCLNSK